MKRIWTIVALALGLCLGFTAALAEGRVLASSGDWVFERRDVPFAFEKDVTLVMGDMCVARTGTDTAFLRVAILSDGTTLAQVASDTWDWPGRNRDVTLVAGSVTVRLQDALYWDDFIDHGTAGEDGGYSSFQLLAQQSGKIEVFNERNQLLARFPSRGFAPMLDRAIRCAQ